MWFVVRAVVAVVLVAAPLTAMAQGWEAEKAKLAAAAESEGELTLFSQPNRAARDFLATEWAKAYPKIKLSISAFAGNPAGTNL